MAPRGRGRLSAIDLLPDDCSAIIAWAADQLAARDRTQLDIYAAFREKLIAVQGETGVGFDIPSFSAFNRFSVRLAQMTRRLEQTRDIAATISERFDAAASDDLTLIAAEAIKTLIFEILQSAGDGGLSTRGAQELANALRAAVAAQSVSTARRQAVEAAFAEKVEDVVETIGKEAGLSAERVAQLRRDFLGVRT
ncbi:DUF3486 family protein [Polymorphum gilvum]|uniref:Phage protein n=1 Tax=Polymorphum gilvum (strain LMG 25793 / CGMCC 1.9160 / SL003B-26A1) TaxID=991905 RepID=F2J650_POLGS|nr:DUF3486 family protein [Polymorphum gilvum]ADZ72414.1 Phage protein [Polymorphum gilvum SL003B-26A1]